MPVPLGKSVLSMQLTKFVLNSKNCTMNIVITGASRGIGFETARIFAQNTEHRVFAISRGKSGLEELQKSCDQNERQKNLHIFPFDLLRDDYSSVLIPPILKQMSHIDILVNNAGSMLNKSFEKTEDADFDLVFNSNIKTAYKLTRHLMPHFSANAHIVNIGSMGGYQGSVKFPGLSLYSASKGALAILTECLAEEFRERNIKVNCLALGSAQTKMLEQAFPGYKAPLSASEIAAFIADFSLNGQRWFNGKVLPVALSTP
jgi:NAD(P)-dependent dehydrogenase (short-subunit alcohol dehydrogenase family)